MDRAELTAVFTEILAQEASIFAPYTRQFTKMQWNVLRAVAMEEIVKNPMSKNFAAKYQPGAPSSKQTALKMLAKNEIVTQDENGYRLHNALFERWLQTI